ncbi:hypothetical protein ACEN88_02070 [Massilia sp. CT11-108]|uniref:hypothetical protein n=1 Tax=Massilia sp. CT11-108 TaxID=3393900 RepID=UPI0039A67127
MQFIRDSVAPTATVYGVVLNDSASARALGDLDAAPYKGAPRAPVLYIKPAGSSRGRSWRRAMRWMPWPASCWRRT